MAINSGNPKEESSEKKDDDKILEIARERFKQCEDYWSPLYQAAKEDIEFSQGDQWPSGVKEERNRDGRPCLVVNKIQQHVNQIANDQRQSRPAIKVNPVDDQADPETAKIRQGLIRHIEYDSNADSAYATGFEFGVTGGIGAWRIITQYSSPSSFKLEAKIKQVKNPFSVYIDPHSKEPDGSDAEFGFVFEDISKDKFKSTYKDAELSGTGNWEAFGSTHSDWVQKDSVRVAEYFYKEYEDDTLIQLSNGAEVLKSKINEILPTLEQGVSIVNERKTTVAKVCWVKINGAEILEKTIFPGSYIPLIPVYGKDIDIDGKRIIKGIVRDAKDPARMYNYYTSAETEAIALTPRAPFIMAEGQVEGYEGLWAEANRRNHAYLVYKPTSINGTAVPPPQRNAIETSTNAITQARMLSGDDIKATTGIYDAALGAKSNETSGIAIQRRTAQANTSNFHFIDNLNRSIRHTGRILNDIIPVVYDAAQAIRIIGEEGQEEVVRINEEFSHNGKPTKYDMSVGKYDVTVDSGPSFQTKRQEAVASMMEFIKGAPQLAPNVMDLLVKNMDWPGASEIAERLKKLLPPPLQDNKGQPEIPPEVKGQMDQQMQMIDQLTAKLNELQQEKEMKIIELESKERIEMAKLENQATIELAKLESKEAVELLAHQIAELDQRTKRDLGFNQPFPTGEPQENFAPQPPIENGGESAGFDQGANEPTGGFSPGQSMEGEQP